MSKIKKYFQEKYNLKISEKIDEIGVNLDGATQNQVIFYRLREGGEQLLRRRIEKSSPGLLILNRQPSFELNVVYAVLDDVSFENEQNSLCNLVYPLQTMPKIVGVTGTNGKTSVCYFSMQLSSFLGFKSLFVGTIGVYDVNGKLATEHRTTTPSNIELKKILYHHRPEVVFIELSSHALEQNRLGGIQLDAAAWTNFSQDHLDYHDDMESYFLAKLKICDHLKKEKKIKVLSQESSLLKRFDENKVKYSKVESLKETPKSKILKLEHNQSNTALSIALCLDVCQVSHIDNDLVDRITSPPGRFDVIPISNESFIVVDFAHTPDAVKQIIKSVRNSFSKSEIITIVGCGGNRDKAKRILMSNVACENSDHAIFTSDNPRDEKPVEILKEMTDKLNFENFSVIEDRFKAIRHGIGKMTESSILLILGKGHESYQEIKGVKHPFDDKQKVYQILRDTQ